MTIKLKDYGAGRVYAVYLVTFEEYGQRKPMYLGYCRYDQVGKMPDLPPAFRANLKAMPYVAETVEIAILEFTTEDVNAVIGKHWNLLPVKPLDYCKERKRGPRSRPIVCNETGEEFSNASEACAYFSIAPPNMSNHLRGHSKRVGGYSFRYIDGEM